MSIERLGINPEAIARARGFAESYAALAARDAEAAVLAIGRRVADNETETPDVWMIEALDAASALVEAASWASLADLSDTARLLTTATPNFRRAGLAYGEYLLSLSALFEGAVEDQASLETVATFLEAADQQHEQVGDAATSQPQQQAYALLAATLSPHLRNELDGLVGRAHESQLRRSTLPIGAAGMRVGDYVRFSYSLANNDRPAAARAVAQFMLLHARSLESASANAYLWENAASPVDVVDLDFLAFTVAAAAEFGPVIQEDIMRLVPGDSMFDALADTILDIARGHMGTRGRPSNE